MLADNAVLVIHPPGRMPLALQLELKAAVDSMKHDGVITKRDEPPDWVNSLLVTVKKIKTF